MCTEFQTIVAKEKYGKRFSECNGGERAKINTFILHRGYYAILKYPKTIAISFDVVLRSARETRPGILFGDLVKGEE